MSSPPGAAATTDDVERAQRRTLSPARQSQMTRRPSTRADRALTAGSIGSIPEHEQTIDNYQLGRTVGKGNFAKVKHARHVLTGMEVAIKIVDKSSLNESSMGKLQREVEIMKRMDHPNIVKLFEVIDTDNTLYLVMEYAAGGEVFDYLVEHGRMKEKDARQKFRQIVSAVEYCHARGVIHRDLKAENLLLDRNLNIKIADFGFSNTYSEGEKLDTFCGSPPYAAPELFQGKRYDGPEVDVWSLGVILYTLVSGSLPFDGQSLRELRERVLRGKYRIPFYMSQECEQLLKRFLAVSPSRRASLRDVMTHEWMNKDCADKLAPHGDPTAAEEAIDMARVEQLERTDLPGFSRERIVASVTTKAFDHQHAAYMLLARVDWAAVRSGSDDPGPSPLLLEEPRERSQSVADPPRRPRSTTGPVQGAANGANGAIAAGSPPIGVPPRVPPAKLVRRKTDSDVGVVMQPLSHVAAAGAATMGRDSKLVPVRGAPQLRQRARRVTESDAGGGGGGPPARSVSAFVGALTPPSSDELDDSASSSSAGATGRSPPKDGSSTLKRAGLLGSFRRRVSRTKIEPGVVPPSPSPGSRSNAQPRVLRFTFSRTNTSARDPTEILQEMQRVLTLNGIKFQRQEAFVLMCVHEKERVHFEMEICKMPRLSMHGIKHRRIGGDSLSYKNVCSKVLQDMAPFLEGGAPRGAQAIGPAASEPDKPAASSGSDHGAPGAALEQRVPVPAAVERGKSS